MQEIIAATGNKGKLKEIRQILADYQVLSLQDIGFTSEIEETGLTFYDNALIKAKAVHTYAHASHPGAAVLADDSGLVIDALDGRPGVFSARYAGENSTQEMLIQKVLTEMTGIPENKRTCRFICSMILIHSDLSVTSAEGMCSGRISQAPRGTNGFGYDPIFMVEEKLFAFSMAELSDIEKNSLSHRRRALDGIKQKLMKGAAGI